MKETYESKDKHICPYLLLQSDINFVGTKTLGNIVYFQFTPAERCKELVNLFLSKKAEPVQPKELLDAVETFRDRVFEMKEKNKYERNF